VRECRFRHQVTFAQRASGGANLFKAGDAQLEESREGTDERHDSDRNEEDSEETRRPL
jgi:hypothetical protein